MVCVGGTQRRVALPVAGAGAGAGAGEGVTEVARSAEAPSSGRWSQPVVASAIRPHRSAAPARGAVGCLNTSSSQDLSFAGVAGVKKRDRLCEAVQKDTRSSVSLFGDKPDVRYTLKIRFLGEFQVIPGSFRT